MFHAFGIGTISGTLSVKSDAMVDVYPNPTTGEFTLMLDGMQGTSGVGLRSSGLMVVNEKVEADGLALHSFNIHPQPGIYLVHVRNGEQVFTQKLIVR